MEQVSGEEDGSDGGEGDGEGRGVSKGADDKRGEEAPAGDGEEAGRAGEVDALDAHKGGGARDGGGGDAWGSEKRVWGAMPGYFQPFFLPTPSSSPYLAR